MSSQASSWSVLILFSDHQRSGQRFESKKVHNDQLATLRACRARLIKTSVDDPLRWSAVSNAADAQLLHA